MSDNQSTFEPLEQEAALLRAAVGVPVVAPRRATFLELTGQSHLETVASRLLEFFLDPAADHGLGHLFLDALLSDPDLQGLGVVSVEREAMTHAGNRLDLLIEGGSHVIGIENKVLAGLDNPWMDYWQHVRDVAGARRPLLVLLLVHAPEPDKVPEYIRVVTYRELMSRVRERLGWYLSGAPAQYASFALDFVETMENRYVGSTMNPKLLELIRAHPSEALAIVEGVKEFGRVAAEKAAQLDAAVMEALGDPPPAEVHNWGFPVRQKLWRCQVFEVELTNAKLPVDAYLTPAGWEISVHERSEPEGGSGPMQTWLEGLPLPKGPSAGGLTVEGYPRIVTARFPFEAPVEVVAQHVVEVVALIRAHGAVPIGAA